MKPQLLIIPLSRPKPKRPEIPDAHTDYLTQNCEKRNRRLTLEQATNVTEMIVVVKPITGIRKWWIQIKLKCQYWAECEAASARVSKTTNQPERILS